MGITLLRPELQAISASNNLYSSGTVVISGGANVTVGTNGQTITISAGGGGGAFSLGVSTGGNTAGATGVTGTRLVFVGTNNITLSQTTDANGGTISISGAGGGAGQFSGGMSNLGNTAGSSGITGTQLVFVGSQNISLSQSTGANGGTISFSGQPSFSAGVSTGGNTAGATGVSGTRLVFVGSHVTLSQTTDANGATITVLGQAEASLSHWNRGIPRGNNTFAATANGTWLVAPLMHQGAPFPGRMTANTLGLAMSFQGSSAQSASVSGIMSSTLRGGIYTLNVSTLSLLNSFSATFGNSAATSINTSNWHGVRIITVHSSGWSSTPDFREGSVYWFGFGLYSHLSSCPASYIGGYSQESNINSGLVGVPGAWVQANEDQQHALFKGRYSATTASPPTSILRAHLSGTGTALQLEPIMRMDMVTWI